MLCYWSKFIKSDLSLKSLRRKEKTMTKNPKVSKEALVIHEEVNGSPGVLQDIELLLEQVEMLLKDCPYHVLLIQHVQVSLNILLSSLRVSRSLWEGSMGPWANSRSPSNCQSGPCRGSMRPYSVCKGPEVLAKVPEVSEEWVLKGVSEIVKRSQEPWNIPLERPLGEIILWDVPGVLVAFPCSPRGGSWDLFRWGSGGLWERFRGEWVSC